jgi:hypothetical protein
VSHPGIPSGLQELFERLNERIDKPIEYNHILSSAIQGLYNLIAPNAITYVGGVPYTLDPNRGYQVSLPRAYHEAGWYGNNITNRYLKVGGVTTGATGILMPRDAVITGLWAKSRNAISWTIELRKNGIPITLVSVPITSGEGYDGNLSITVDQGDYIQFYASGTSIDHPIAVAEIAWRI